MNKAIFLPILLLVSLIVFLAACNSKELSRLQAQSLIEASNDYKQPYSLSLTQGGIATGGQGKLPVLENGVETPAQAVERKTKRYMEIYPQVAAANHLGLVEAQVKALEAEQPKKQSWMDEPAWFFEERYLTTDKGKALWKDYNLPPLEDSIPLAEKQLVEVTGITKQGEEAATAQFTWKFVPNETSKYFDSTTAEFKSLPSDLQQNMLGKQPPTILNRNPEDKTIKFATAARQGQATFRRYDDGWRLESVLFQ